MEPFHIHPPFDLNFEAYICVDVGLTTPQNSTTVHNCPASSLCHTSLSNICFLRVAPEFTLCKSSSILRRRTSFSRACSCSCSMRRFWLSSISLRTSDNRLVFNCKYISKFSFQRLQKREITKQRLDAISSKEKKGKNKYNVIFNKK